MKDIMKSAIGVALGLAIWAVIVLAVAIPIMAYKTPSAYEKCLVRCHTEAENIFQPYILLYTIDEYVELMEEAMNDCFDGICRDEWGWHDEFHSLMGITYISR